MAEAKSNDATELLREHYERNCEKIRETVTDDAFKEDALAVEKLVFGLAAAVELWAQEQDPGSNAQIIFQRLFTAIMRLLLTSIERASGNQKNRAEIFTTFFRRSLDIGIDANILPQRDQPSHMIKPSRTLLDVNGRPISKH